MRRFITSKTQRSGYNYLSKRQERALIARDPHAIPTRDTVRRRGAMFSVGVVVIAILLGLVARFLLGKATPGNEQYIMLSDGATYVKIDEAWHPVSNTASARLVLGSPVSPKKVKTDSLKDQTIGTPIGIPGAPSSMTLNPKPESTGWGTCTEYTPADQFDLTKPESTSLTVLAGVKATGADPLTPSQAVLTRDVDTGKYWLVTGNAHRLEVNPNDTLTFTFLGLDARGVDNATPVPSRFLNELDTYRPLAAPDLDGRGEPSGAVPGYAVGTILTHADATAGKWVVTKNGLARVSDYIAALFTSTGSEKVEQKNTRLITEMPHDDASFRLNEWPDALPTVVTGDTICNSWERNPSGNGNTTLISVAKGLPLTDTQKRQLVELRDGNGGIGGYADYLYTRPGYGWLTQSTSVSQGSTISGQLWYVSDAGVRYTIGLEDEKSYDPTLKSLGLDSSKPVYVPWQILSLLPTGPDLSKEAALRSQ